MKDPNRKVVDIVLEALLARGWSHAESRQIIGRLVSGKEDNQESAKTRTNDPAHIFRFGKWRGYSVEQVASEDPRYLRWLYQQRWFRELYPPLYAYMCEYMGWGNG